jgi:hypothetical protein
MKPQICERLESPTEKRNTGPRLPLTSKKEITKLSSSKASCLPRCGGVSYARCNAYASAKHEFVRNAPALPDRPRVLVRPLDVLQTGVISSVTSQGSVDMS